MRVVKAVVHFFRRGFFGDHRIVVDDYYYRLSGDEPRR